MQKTDVLYISGEESLQQIKIRAERIGEFGDTLSLLCETNLDTIKEVISRTKPEIVVIDSIQTMYNENITSAPGSVSQVREATGVLMQIAKGLGISIFIVGHVTKTVLHATQYTICRMTVTFKIQYRIYYMF